MPSLLASPPRAPGEQAGEHECEDESKTRSHGAILLLADFAVMPGRLLRPGVRRESPRESRDGTVEAQSERERVRLTRGGAVSHVRLGETPYLGVDESERVLGHRGRRAGAVEQGERHRLTRGES